jgi:hypothetical protein
MSFYLLEMTLNTASPFHFSAAIWCQLNPTGLRAETGHAHRIGSIPALKRSF